MFQWIKFARKNLYYTFIGAIIDILMIGFTVVFGLASFHSENGKSFLFFESYTFSAIILCINIILIDIILFIHVVDRVNLLLLLAFFIIVFPALRLDNLIMGSYWLAFIPDEVFMLLMIIPVILIILNTEYVIVRILLPISYLLSVAGLILYIARINGQIETHWIFLIIPASLGIELLIWGINKTWKKEQKNIIIRRATIITIGIFTFVQPSLFALRVDRLFVINFFIILLPTFIVLCVIFVVLSTFTTKEIISAWIISQQLKDLRKNGLIFDE